MRLDVECNAKELANATDDARLFLRQALEREAKAIVVKAEAEKSEPSKKKLCEQLCSTAVVEDVGSEAEGVSEHNVVGDLPAVWLAKLYHAELALIGSDWKLAKCCLLVPAHASGGLPDC